ncbi:MAG: YlxR family protein [Chloroflexi bacterium]|nr:YlxR family protein [Chloroflexota bacterium]
MPQRTCLGCRAIKPKQSLIRIVRTAEGGALVDTTGKARGRGAYLCPTAACAKKALRANILNRALRVTLDNAALAELRASVEQISETACTSAHAP